MHYVYTPGSGWAAAYDARSPVYSLAVYDGGLYASGSANPSKIHVYDGDTWEVAYTDPLLFFDDGESDPDAGDYHIGAGSAAIGAQVHLGLADGLDAADLVIYVSGQNGQDGDVAGNPKAVELGQQNEAAANVYALSGTLLVGQNTQASGAFLGRWVVVGQQASLA